MSFRARHLLGIEHLSPQEIVTILDLADRYVDLNRRTVKQSDVLAGMTQINMFFENSTRTRTSFELAGLLGPILIGLASDKLFGARRMPACVLSLLALTVTLALFMGALHTGSVMLVVALLFVMGLTLYGPDSMISGAAAIDFGKAKAGATAAGFVNGCGSVGAVLGGLLPGYFDSVTVFIVFAGCALFSALVLIPHWNSRPVGVMEPRAYVPNRALTVKPLRN